MLLIVDELLTTLENEFTMTENAVISNVRPYLYIAGSPAGTLKCSIFNGATEICTFTQTIAAIRSSFGDPNFLHGYVNFAMDKAVYLPSGSTLKVVIEGTGGYVYDVNNYVGWIQEFENLKTTPTTTPGGDLDKPHTFELWGYWGNSMGKRILDFNDGYTSATTPVASGFTEIAIEDGGFLKFKVGAVETWRVGIDNNNDLEYSYSADGLVWSEKETVSQ